MRPPALAEALVAAAAPSSDYESVAGDLHEEYLRVMHLSGARVANHWYWTQALFSIPSLLSYSRSNRSVLPRIGVALIALAVLVAMLVVITLIEMVVQRLFGPDGIPDWVWLCVNYADAVLFGAILARLVRTDGPRIAFFASLFLVACFVVPALAGHPGSQAPLAAWIILCGAVPAMCFGAGLYQAIRRRADSPN
jgi:hypothetical protein